jgi:hypothetical protein
MFLARFAAAACEATGGGCLLLRIMAEGHSANSIGVGCVAAVPSTVSTVLSTASMVPSTIATRLQFREAENNRSKDF